MHKEKNSNSSFFNSKELLLYFKLLKPEQYLKNLLIFAPLFFSGSAFLFSIDYIILFLSFSALTSSVYIFNDLFDLNEDKSHPLKKLRPLPAKKIKIRTAYYIAICLFFFSISLIYFFGKNLIILYLIYFFQNILYSKHLKRILILDIFIVSLGFLIRLFIGSIYFNLQLSIWLILLTQSIVFFIILVKRKVDFKNETFASFKYNSQRKFYKSKISLYGIRLTQILIFMLYSIYLVFLYLDKNTNYFLIISSFFLSVFIILRYYESSMKFNYSSPLKILFYDKSLIFTSLTWFLINIMIYYYD